MSLCKFLVLKCLRFCGSHSDNNLVELENEPSKEDDRAVLLEGGLAKSVALKSSPSIKQNLMR